MGDQPRAIDELVAGVDPRRPDPGAAGHHRQRQDVHDGAGRREDPAPDAGDRPQQDARAPALDGVQGALPRQRRPLLRQLLRLLPARGVRPVDRHVHREGLAHQRRDRPHAPRGDLRAAHAPRRADRRIGVVHLRHRRRRGLPGHEAGPGEGGRGAARRRAAPPGRDPVRAQRRRLRARHVPRARRHRRDLPGLRAREGDPRSNGSATRSR